MTLCFCSFPPNREPAALAELRATCTPFSKLYPINCSSFRKGEEDSPRGSQSGCVMGLVWYACTAISQGQVLSWFLSQQMKTFQKWQQGSGSSMLVYCPQMVVSKEALGFAQCRVALLVAGILRVPATGRARLFLPWGHSIWLGQNNTLLSAWCLSRFAPLIVIINAYFIQSVKLLCYEAE